jgi:hypothetical protein
MPGSPSSEDLHEIRNTSPAMTAAAQITALIRLLFSFFFRVLPIYKSSIHM